MSSPGSRYTGIYASICVRVYFLLRCFWSPDVSYGHRVTGCWWHWELPRALETNSAQCQSEPDKPEEETSGLSWPCLQKSGEMKEKKSDFFAPSGSKGVVIPIFLARILKLNSLLSSDSSLSEPKILRLVSFLSYTDVLRCSPSPSH